MSTYSTNLALELIGTGEQAGTWGNTTNTNLGTLIEQAISGYVTQAVSTGTDTTITIPNGATGVARNMFIELTGTGGTNTNLIVPANKKLYFIYNNASGAVTVKVSGQTGVSVAAGTKVILVSNGTDIVTATSYLTSGGDVTFSSLTLSGGTANGVLYLNGSKVATSGSALVFDGTNLGLGVTPSAWSLITPMQIKNASFAGYLNRAYVFANSYFDGSNNKYIASDYATYYSQQSGQHQWYYAASGTAGNAITFTQAMTLDAAGRLLLGVTSGAGNATLDLVANSGAGAINIRGRSSDNASSVYFYSNDNATLYSYISQNAATDFQLRAYANIPMVFYTNNAERARITATGNLLVGTTTDVSGRSGTISDISGNVRAIPRTGAAKTGSYTLAVGDVGQFVEVGSGGSVTVPNSTFAMGDVVSIFNNTSGNVTLTMSITTAYIAGTDADKNTITLATRGVATILFISGTVCVVSGNVS